jgi:hypothetical protein
MPNEPVPLSELERDLPEPADGWAAALAARGAEIIEDDIGRPAVARSVARQLLAEHRSQQEETARRRVEIEQRAIEADQRFRASLPSGIPAGAVPAGMTAAQLLMAADPFPTKRRQSVLEHSLEHPAGALIYTPVNEEAS